MIYDLLIKTKPLTKQRPRFSRNGIVFTPKQTTDYERLIAVKWKEKYKTPIKEAVEVEMIFSFERPKSWSKKKKENTFFHTVKPDIDNLQKAILDGLNKVAFEDDKQVFSVKAKKIYDDENSVRIMIKDYEI